MSQQELDITDSLDWEEGLPRPRWDLIESRVDSQIDPGAQWDVWTVAARQWLTELGAALDKRYGVIESDHFLMLASQPEETGTSLLQFAERCRVRLLSSLEGVAEFDGRGKQVVVELRNPKDYFQYICVFLPEGERGGSVGVQIREGYPHIALHGRELWSLENTLSHELTHASLHKQSMPLWLEEGLAQMFEHDMTGRSLLDVTTEMAGLHKRYWGKHGLDAFWCGEGFSRPGKVQELSYQLAEILARLMVEESRPRWFGWVREPQVRFFAFLRDANAADCGAAAAGKHLGLELSSLAAKFLGPGNWSPSL